MEEGGLLRFPAFLHIKEQVDSISIQSIKLTPISFVSHILIQLHLFFFLHSVQLHIAISLEMAVTYLLQRRQSFIQILK